MLRVAIAGAAAFPDHGSVVLMGKRLYRKRRAGEHALLYRVYTSRVTIVRVLHGASDWGRHLP